MVGRTRLVRLLLGLGLSVAVGLAWPGMLRAQDVPEQPYFLVAQPQLGDPLFAQSVIMMLPAATAPPMLVGLIVNKPTKVQLPQLFPNSPILKNRPGNAYFGGPVDMQMPSLAFRSDRPQVHSIHLLDNLYVNLDPDMIGALLKTSQPVPELRIYLGRSQWDPEQLRSEMLEGSWYVVKADPTEVFSKAPERIWRTLVTRARLQVAVGKAQLAPGAAREVFAGPARVRVPAPALMLFAAPN